jgi:ABC-2 type transport system permease protein
MTASTFTFPSGAVSPDPRMRIARFGRLIWAEWTKIRSVPSTVWSLAVLILTTVGLNTAVVGLAIANWDTATTATRHSYLADPTGFLAAALVFAQIPVCVLGVLVITGEYATGMISSSMLAVPRRTPMLAAKAIVFGPLTFVVGELVAFASFGIAEAIARRHVPMSLSNPAEFRAVFGVGLYLGVLALLSLSIGALVRHTGAAIAIAVGLVTVVSGLAKLIPGSAAAHISACLPASAGLLITHASHQASDLLSPWQGFTVFCLWAAVLLAGAACALSRRDV